MTYTQEKDIIFNSNDYSQQKRSLNNNVLEYNFSYRSERISNRVVQERYI